MLLSLVVGGTRASQRKPGTFMVMFGYYTPEVKLRPSVRPSVYLSFRYPHHVRSIS